MNIKNGMLVKVVHLPTWKTYGYSIYLGQQGVVQNVDKDGTFEINFGNEITAWWSEEDVQVVGNGIAKALDAILAKVTKYNRALHPDYSHYSTFDEYCAYRQRKSEDD